LLPWRTRRGERGGFYHALRPVGLHEGGVRHPSYVRLTYFCDVINVAKELPPVSVERLGAPQLERQALVVPQFSDQVRLGARLDHLELLIRDVFLSHTFDLRVNSVASF